MVTWGREDNIWMDTIIPKNKKIVDRKKPSVNIDLLHEAISSSSEEEEDLNIENININEISNEEFFFFFFLIGIHSMQG